MPYVKYDDNGNVIGTSRHPCQPDNVDYLEDDDPKVIDFINGEKEYMPQDIRDLFSDAELVAINAAIRQGDDTLGMIMFKLQTRLTPMKKSEASVMAAANYINSVGLASDAFKAEFGLK